MNEAAFQYINAKMMLNHTELLGFFLSTIGSVDLSLAILAFGLGLAPTVGWFLVGSGLFAAIGGFIVRYPGYKLRKELDEMIPTWSTDELEAVSKAMTG